MDTLAISRTGKLTDYRDNGATPPAPMAISYMPKYVPNTLPQGRSTSPQRAAGFNYGTGNAKAVADPLYIEADVIATRLRAASTLASDAAWKGEMLLRELRIAETADEIFRARFKLICWRIENDPRDSKGDPTPNYSFAELATVKVDTANAGRTAPHKAVPAGGHSFTGQPSPGAAVTLPTEFCPLCGERRDNRPHRCI